MANGFDSEVLTTEDKAGLNALLASLDALARRDDNKLAASILVVVWGHLKRGQADIAALYLTQMLRDINSLNNWYSREVNLDAEELRQRILDGANR